MEFGQRFKEIRKQNDYTQQQLADILHIHQANISDWENNVSRPEYENLISLSRIYGESIDYILGNNNA